MSIPFPTKSSNDDPSICYKASLLIATIQQFDQELAILPLKDSNLPLLLSQASFPTKAYILKKYFTIPNFDSCNAKIYAYFQSTTYISKIKSNPFVHACLKKFNIWIDANNIESHNIT